MPGTTAKVTEISPKATEKDLREFFSFSGVVQSIEIKKGETADATLTAYITFKTVEGLNTAVLLTGAVIVGEPVTIVPAGDDYIPPPAPLDTTPSTGAIPETAAGQENRVQTVFAGLMAHGYVLGKGAMDKARAFEQKHKISATAQERAAAVNTKLGITSKVSAASAAVGTQVKAVDDKYKIGETTKTILTSAEQKVNDAAQAVMKNKHVAATAVFVSESFRSLTKAAGDVTAKAMGQKPGAGGASSSSPAGTTADVKDDTAPTAGSTGPAVLH